MSATGFEMLNLYLSKLSRVKENPVALTPEREITVEVTDKNGKPIKGVRVETKHWFENVITGYSKIKKTSESTWSTTLSKYADRYGVRVLVGDSTVYLKNHPRKTNRLKIQLPHGQHVIGQVDLRSKNVRLENIS